MSTAVANLTNHFLIAMPQLADPNFFQTVTYICQHDGQGAMGIVINRPLELDLSEILQHLELDVDSEHFIERPVLMGGPVMQERGFVIHEPASEWESTLRITDTLAVTTSKDILAALARGAGPQRCLIALGYAGWRGGQLEEEIIDNSWLNGPADEEILFDLAYEERWAAAAARLGVDLNLLSGDAGHA